MLEISEVSSSPNTLCGWHVNKIITKEIQIIRRLFLVCHLLLQTKSVPSQPASNVGGLVIH